MARTGLMVLLVALLLVVGTSLVVGVPIRVASGDHSHGEHLVGLEPASVDWSAKDMDYWRSVLSSEQVRVCRKAGTERPFTGEYVNFKEDGVFACSSCGHALFASQTKFRSGTGWPSYWAPIAEGAVSEHVDTALGMVRVEVRCGRCDAHLGHVFEDGPRPTGKRYCINSVCLMHRPPA